MKFPLDSISVLVLAALGTLGIAHAEIPTSYPRPPSDPYHDETPAERDARMAWWRDARFGMFIHWGLYAVPAGIYDDDPQEGGGGEWIMLNKKIPVARYAEYAKEFNPTEFDAEKWAQLAQDAGMKYIVITTKHHDGFAMYPSKVGGFNLRENSPFKRDPLAELAAACRKRGLKLGFYYSQNQDWHQPGGASHRGSWDPAQEGDMDEYVRKVALPQVEELLTNYGPDVPAVLWWDTPFEQFTMERAELFQPLLARKPGLITNNRLSAGAPPGQGFPGDIETPEQHIPVNGFPGLDWEVCMTINGTWGFMSNETNWKSTGTLLRNLIDIASKGGNYLLNVGPTAAGVIPEPEVERLEAIGAWLKVNGQAIYGTQATPFADPFSWGRVTSKGYLLYLHVFDWPADRQLVLPMRGKVKRAVLLARPGEALPVSVTPDGVAIELPATAPDPIASVIAVEVAGPVDPFPASDLMQKADGSFRLPAASAAVQTRGGGEPELRVESNDHTANLGYWLRPEDSAHWEAELKQPGTFEVSVDYAVAAGQQSRLTITAPGDVSLTGSLEETGDWKTYRTTKLGTVRIAETGMVPFTVTRTGAACNLRSVSFKRVGD